MEQSTYPAIKKGSNNNTPDRFPKNNLITSTKIHIFIPRLLRSNSHNSIFRASQKVGIKINNTNDRCDHLRTHIIMATVRYSDSDLEEFKELILEKLKEAKEDLNLLRGSLSHSDNHGTDDTGRTFNMMEDGSDTLSREEVAQLASRQEKFVASLQNALVRIENKTYGICRVTGKLIRKERLKLVPHATLSIEAKNEQG